MSEAMSTVPEDSNAPGAQVESAALDSEASGNGQEAKRRRRKFKPEEVAIALAIRDLAPMGQAIPYDQLTIEMKMAVLPTSKLRLVERELLEPDYDINTGKITSVTVSSDKWSEYEDDLTPPPVKPVTPVELQRRQPRNIINDPKYRIKLNGENPRRDKTHAWYNWQECYKNGMTVPDYFSNLDYDRNIKVESKRGTAYFNGPSTIFLLQDLKSGAISIYDSSLQESDDNYYMTAADIEVRAYGSAEEDESVADSATPSQGQESTAQAA